MLGVLLLFYGDAFRIPFLSDDCVFLDHTNRVPFLQWWGTRYPFFNFWRPWSREFHYGAMQALFDHSELAFHVASWVLLAGCLAAFHALARRMTDARAAGFATVGVSAMAAWGLPALSISGVQELWMMLASVLAVIAWSSGRMALAILLLAVALASKETSCLLPGLFLSYDLVLERRTIRSALERMTAPALLTLAWATVHPQFGGRWFWHVRLVESRMNVREAFFESPARALGSLLSLDRLPVPDGGWLRALVLALPAATLLAAAAWLLAGGTSARTNASRRPGSRLAIFSLCWMLLGWLPLALPSLSWHAYYGLFGAMGGWLLLGTWLSRAPLVLGMVIAGVLGILSLARTRTRTADWADASYQREAGRMTRDIRRSLLGLRPSFPSGTRVFLVPDAANESLVGRILSVQGSTLRVWYRNPSLIALPLSSYAMRRLGTRPGEDFFFRLDSLSLCHELPTADRESAPATPSQEWRNGHEDLGKAFARAGDSSRAYAEFAMVAQAIPRDLESAWEACATAHDAGDLAAAKRWLLEAENRPGDDPAIRNRLARAREELLGQQPRSR